MLSKTLERLCCPGCVVPLKAHELTVSDGHVLSGRLECPRCAAQFHIRHGIPILWKSDAACVALWQHRYGDFVLSPDTFKAWDALQADQAGEGALWNRMRAAKKWAPWAGTVGAVALIAFITAMILAYSVAATAAALLAAAGLGILIYFWHLQRRHLYLCRYNYFVQCVRQLSELNASGGLSEREHFGGGKEVFEQWTGQIMEEAKAAQSEELAHKENHQKRFVARKSRYVRKKLASRFTPEVIGQWQVLCLGCGGPSHQAVNRLFHYWGCELTGIDTQDFNTLAFQSLFQADAVLANAMRLPLAGGLFDCVVFTDVLEHLHDPMAGLKEIHRVLKPGGLLLMTTNNRHHYKLAVNPLAAVHVWLGQWFPDLLPRRDILQNWGGKVFHHGEFSRREILNLLREVDFRSISLRTNNFFSDEQDANRPWPMLAARLGLGEEFFVLAKKPLQ